MGVAGPYSGFGKTHGQQQESKDSMKGASKQKDSEKSELKDIKEQLKNMQQSLQRLEKSQDPLNGYSKLPFMDDKQWSNGDLLLSKFAHMFWGKK